MTDYFEIDFLKVGEGKSGDAIPMRYSHNGQTRIHVTDGGFKETGASLVDHINLYYNSPSYIDHVVVTHSDRDHTGGRVKLLETYTIGELWMLRPWLYADELINRFPTYKSVEALKQKLKREYLSVAELEEIAKDKGICIRDPFQEATIGAFRVLAPTKTQYLKLIAESDKTPQSTQKSYTHSRMDAFASALTESRSLSGEFGSAFMGAKYGNSWGLSSDGSIFTDAKRRDSYGGLSHAYLLMGEKRENLFGGLSHAHAFTSNWGEEIFPDDDTGAENNMSVIQYGRLCGKSILLTGDAGCAALDEAADYVRKSWLWRPDYFQIPHHGSRHNVSTKMLDRWLGCRQDEGQSLQYTAIVSASKGDDDHPRKSVVRAFMHRGRKVFSTKEGGISISSNLMPRRGWGAATALSYPAKNESE